MTSQIPTVITAIQPDPLSVDAALAAVQHPRAGAVALFVGTVRDHDGGREGVRKLEYSAHPEASQILADLAKAAAASEPDQVHGVYAVHRTGPLQVGDLAVVCAVAAEHRAEAFAVAEALIEQLKAKVPIWKRQQYADGTHDWVGSPGEGEQGDA